MYSELTTQNRSLLKRFSHRSRFQLALQLINAQPGETILDFGTGDGQLLTMLQETEPNCRIVGYEPVPQMFAELQTQLAQSPESASIAVCNHLDDCPTKVDKISCLEVLEHLTPDRQIHELRRLKERLTPQGRMIVSVPIEIGFASLLKNFSRVILRQTHGNTNLITIWRSWWGLPIARGDADYLPSHIGFFYPDLERVFRQVGLRVLKRRYSPMPALGKYINSQVFFVLDQSSNT